jgi:hypothetical protein
VEAAAPLKIEKGAFGNIFLMIFTAAWKTPLVFHSYHRPAAVT